MSSAEHARLMDGVYRGQRHIYDLTRKYYLFGRDGTIRGLKARPGDTLLELGCGTGRNLRLAARHFPGVKLHGLDISREMLETARAKFTRFHPSPILLPGDATHFSPAAFGLTGFDRILISYALSMIPEWQGTIRAAMAALSPGGSLHIVDFGGQERLPHWFRALLRAWLARFHVAPRDTLAPFLHTLTHEHGLALTVESLGRGYAIRAILHKANPHKANLHKESVY